MQRSQISTAGLLPAISALLVPINAFADAAPDGALSAVGALITLLAAVVLAILGFVWYPVCRLLQRDGDERFDEFRGPDNAPHARK